MMRSGKSPIRPRNFSKCRYSAGISVLFIFLMGFGFQGCVIHSHGNHSAHYKTKTQSHKNHKHHKHQDTHYRKPAPKTVDKIPSYKEQHPSHTHQPPSHARAYEVARGKPFTEGEHPSSHGQEHKAGKGKPHMEGEHPSSHGQEHKARKGKPHMEDEHPSSHGKGHKVNKGKPDKGDDHPSSHGQGHQAGKGKPDKEEDRPSSQGKNHKKGPGTDKGSGHPSSHAQGNQGHNKDKEKPLWGDESISNHAKQEDVIEHSFSSHDEKIQLANAEPIQDKGNAKGFSKGKKINHGKHKKQTDETPTVAHREPLSGVIPSQPAATTASYAPLVFDSNQRITIQSYYQKSGSKNPGKGRRKQIKKPKRKQTLSLTKNDILTQPSKSLPQSLESQLPPSPPNTKRVLYHQQVLLIERNTNRVLDVINVNN